MDTLKIITNNAPRPVLRWHELTLKEQKEFDYLDTELKQLDATFVRYKGAAYHLEDVEWIDTTRNYADHPFKGWVGKVSDSFFSGVLFKWHGNDFEEVICGAIVAAGMDTGEHLRSLAFWHGIEACTPEDFEEVICGRYSC